MSTFQPMNRHFASTFLVEQTTACAYVTVVKVSTSPMVSLEISTFNWTSTRIHGLSVMALIWLWLSHSDIQR